MSTACDGKVIVTKEHLDNLREKIRERFEIIRTLVDFASEIVSERGTRTHYDMHSAHTDSTWVLEDFQGFKFVSDSSGFGNHSMEIFHRGQPMLKANWNSSLAPESLEVTTFDRNPEWQHELRRVIRDKPLIIASIEASKIRETQLSVEQRRLDAELKTLSQIARSLNL